MNWTELDWESLDRHREQFLGARPSDGPYWASAEDLESYDLTFGERIGWKWDAVLAELRLQGWRPPGGVVLDWGCGSGIAGRRVVAAYGTAAFSSLLLWDHSPLAVDFAAAAARRAFPGLEVAAATPAFLAAQEPIGLLVISHVLNELPPAALAELEALIARARAVLWAEPGSRETSRALGKLRDGWLPQFRLVAPCTHAKACPVLAPGNERHWCHFFAAPPGFIFADPNWVKFGQRAGIDLRSLPYSFLALDREGPAAATGLSRVIGRPETFKPYVRLLNCDAEGLAELEVPKRSDPALFKELGRTKAPLVYRWTREGNKIVGGAGPHPRS
jgi:hypothetical protein